MLLGYRILIPLPIVLLLSAVLLLPAVEGCRPRAETPSWSHIDSLRIIRESQAHRAEADEFFRHSPDSPFNRDTTIRYTGIRWFPIDVGYYLRARLERYGTPETVVVYGTKGEPRPQLRYGYFIVSIEGNEVKLNVYKDAAPTRNPSLARHLAVWFTDSTTGKETYHVGRYVEVGEEQTSEDALYTINLNNSYNPYCAYSALYSCAIPTKADRLSQAVRAGELTYHE